MLAEAAEAPFDSPSHLFEVKWDGFRCLAFLTDTTRLQSRNLHDLTPQYPELAQLHLAFIRKPVVLDGELVLFTQGRPDFSRLLRRSRLQKETMITQAAKRDPVVYLAFDLLYLDGQNIMPRPLRERRSLLAEAFTGGDFIALSEYIIGQGKAFAHAVFTRGLEGIMAKDLSSPYLPGQRSRAWLKIKARKTREVTILGYLPTTFGDGLRSLAVGEEPVPGQGYLFRGLVGSGLSVKEIGQLRQLLEPLPRNRPFALFRTPLPPETRDLVWVQPRQRCLVQYLELTPEGYFRHPVYLGLVLPKAFKGSDHHA